LAASGFGELHRLLFWEMILTYPQLENINGGISHFVELVAGAWLSKTKSPQAFAGFE